MWIQIFSPCKNLRKKTMFGEFMFSKNNSPFHLGKISRNPSDFFTLPHLCGFMDSPSIEVAGAMTPTTCGASFTGSLKQLILRLSEVDIHPCFFPKVIDSKCQCLYKQHVWTCMSTYVNLLTFKMSKVEREKTSLQFRSQPALETFQRRLGVH